MGVLHRTALGLLALTLAVAPLAAAQGPGSSRGGPPAGTHHPEGPPSPETPSPPARPDASEPASHMLVAPLRFAAGGTLVIDGGQVDAVSPWAGYLAPGMWLRLVGRWDGAVFHASSLDVARPGYFSYYLGPGGPLGLGPGWVEAWFGAEAPREPPQRIETHSVPAGLQTVALARAVEGAWAALPPAVGAPEPAGDGWALLHGRADGAAVRWTSALPFP